MNQVMKSEASPAHGHTYAEPLAGLRVSWGAILAGAVAALAVSLILWGLAVAIILTATNPTAGSLKGSLLAIWIVAMATTLIGAFVGGALAGYLPGNKSRVMAGAHGFMAWAVAFLVSWLGMSGFVGGMLRWLSNTAVTTATSVAQTAGSAAGGLAGTGAPLDSRLQSFLTSLGYSQAQAQQMVGDFKNSMQDVLQRGFGGNMKPQGALDTLIAWSAGLSWSFYGTWLVSAALAIGGGVAAIEYMRRRRERELAPAPGEAEVEPRVATPPSLTPAE